jgi:modulator of FtsH protease HflC
MNRFYLTMAIVIGILITLSNSIFIVQQSTQAIVFQFGEAIRTVEKPGIHFKVPFIQNERSFDKRILNFDLHEEELQAQDKKRIIVSAFLKYKIVDTLKYYQALGTGDASSRLGSILESSLRQIIGQNPLHNLLSNERITIIEKIETIISQKTQRYGLEIVDLRILRADLPVENSAAIYRRMQSDREMEAREYRAQGKEEAQRITSEADKSVKLLLATAYKESQILRGEGEKISTQIYADAYSLDPDFYNFYKSMEVYKNSFTHNNTKMVISPKNNFMKFFFDKD